MTNTKEEKQKSKFDSRKTSMKVAGVLGSVHASVGYCNDEADTISFSNFRKEWRNDAEQYDKEVTHHYITLSKKDLQELFEMLKLNELVK